MMKIIIKNLIIIRTCWNRQIKAFDGIFGCTCAVQGILCRTVSGLHKMNAIRGFTISPISPMNNWVFSHISRPLRWDYVLTVWNKVNGEVNQEIDEMRTDQIRRRRNWSRRTPMKGDRHIPTNYTSYSSSRRPEQTTGMGAWLVDAVQSWQMWDRQDYQKWTPPPP